jgi:hypothetical protein
MRRSAGSALAALAVIVGTLSVGTPSALASTWTVTNGGNFTAKSTNAVFKDTTTNQVFNCTFDLNGVAPNGTGLSGAGIAHIISGTFTCTGPLGATVNGNVTAGTLNAVSYNPTAPGTTSLTITGLAATAAIHDLLGNCNTSVTGALNNVRYSNNGVLTVTADTSPALTIASASGSGCAGLVKAGDKATLSGTFAVSPVITITSP